ncbi:MAG: F0F1 ATP synthase subunit B [Marinilabiliaceae bacterium]|nr:F0F1 ATP synthase subunit B [Marinilabiliaceae bacterium]
MDLITPELGLVLWTSLTFLVLIYLLGKYAWKPIMHSLKVREETIEYSLREAENARQELVTLEKTKKKYMDEAKSERDALIKEAKEIKAKIIEEARTEARIEADKIVKSAQEQITAEKASVIEDLKKQVAILSVDIASHILENELEKSGKQQELINKYLKEVNFN